LKVLRTAADVRAWRARAARVALVPTMGALHDGHAALIRRAVAESDVAVVSIFVNPTQFGPHEDLAAYPRKESSDVALCERLGATMVFAPSVEEMYPPNDETRVHPGALAERLEGAARPGHFTGVCTIVAKLFAIVRPDTAYLGQKDFQQLRVIQAMARDLKFAVRVVACPIVREAEGLALSSRNAYLTPEERERARLLSRGLFRARDLWGAGERDPARLREAVRETAAAEGVELEYVSVADPFTLEELRAPAGKAVISLAARVGKTRLIDNVLLGTDLDAFS
jgi:pantoate--beta-alanine ligase